METITFIFGTFITLLVVGSIGMLLWAAVEDGKAQRLRDQADHAATTGDTPPPVYSNSE